MVQITPTVLLYEIAVKECADICGKALQVRRVAHRLHCMILTLVAPSIIHPENFPVK